MKSRVFLAFISGMILYSGVLSQGECMAQGSEPETVRAGGGSMSQEEEAEMEKKEMQRVNEMLIQSVQQSREDRQVIRKEQETKQLDRIRRGQ